MKDLMPPGYNSKGGNESFSVRQDAGWSDRIKAFLAEVTNLLMDQACMMNPDSEAIHKIIYIRPLSIPTSESIRKLPEKKLS